MRKSSACSSPLFSFSKENSDRGRPLAALILSGAFSPSGYWDASTRPASAAAPLPAAAAGDRVLVEVEVRHDLVHDLADQLLGVHGFSSRYSTRRAWGFFLRSHRPASLMWNSAAMAWYFGRAIWSLRTGTGSGDSPLA